MSAARAAGRRAGLTLVEVTISIAILGLLSVIVLSTTVPASQSAAETGVALDMDRVAQKLLAQLRRDLRRSGFSGGTARFGSTAVGTMTNLQTGAGSQTLTLQVRTDVATWSGDIVWTLSGSDVRRTENGLTTSMTDGRAGGSVGGVSDLRFLIPANDQVCDVTLVFTRVNPRNGQTISRRYFDRVEMMNR